MDVNELTPPDSWSALCHSANADFRGICNAVVDVKMRPVKRRVIERLGRSMEAQAVFRRTWRRATREDTPADRVDEDLFFDLLSRSNTWSILVLEGIDREKRWRDPFSASGFANIVERFRALAEKCFGEHADTGRRVAASAIVGVGSLVVVHSYAPKVLDKVTLPIHVAWAENTAPLAVRFSPEGSMPPIKPTFAGPQGETTIPVRLTSPTDQSPLRIHFEADGSDRDTPSTALNSIAKQLRLTNRRITETPRHLDTLVHLTSNETTTGLLEELREVSRGVKSLTGELNSVAKGELDVAQQQETVLRDNLRLLARTAVEPYREVVTQLQRNSTQPMVVPTADTDGTRRFETVVLCTGNSVSVQGLHLSKWGVMTAREGSPCVPDHRTVSEGGHSPELAKWMVTVKSIQTHWYGKPWAIVTFSPGKGEGAGAEIARQ